MTTTTTIAERFDHLDTAIQQGRVCRDAWVDPLGRACLLFTLAPEIENESMELRYDAQRCPADLMPAWLAVMTTHIDDEGSAKEWPATIRRYASVVRRACLTFSADEWERVYVSLFIALLDAVLTGYEHALTPAQARWIEQTRATGTFYSFAEIEETSAPDPADSGRSFTARSGIETLFCLLRVNSKYGEYGDLLAFVRGCMGRASIMGFRGEPFARLPPAQWDLINDTILDTIEAALPPKAAP